jgi:hypothetical protein
MLYLLNAGSELFREGGCKDEVRDTCIGPSDATSEVNSAKGSQTALRGLQAEDLKPQPLELGLGVLEL